MGVPIPTKSTLPPPLADYHGRHRVSLAGMTLIMNLTTSGGHLHKWRFEHSFLKLHSNDLENLLPPFMATGA